MKGLNNIPKGRLRPPPALKAKQGVADMEFDEKIALGERYVAGQGQVDPTIGAKIAPQAGAVQQLHDALIQKIADRKVLADLLFLKDKDITDTVHDYDASLADYAYMAGRLADGDAMLLEKLGGSAATTTRKRVNGPPDAPSAVELSEGTIPGSLVVKQDRPAGAASFGVEYKIEPSKPEDPWIAPDALHSRKKTQQITGLPPGQLVRVRVRALGDGWGPYSAEVVGKAK